jgi:hypothetical protein
MRGFVVFVMMGVLAACGGSSSDGGAPTTLAPAVAPGTVPTVAPPTTVIADTATSDPATTEMSAMVTTPATVAPSVSQPPPSGDGLGESIGVSDSVTIIVSDPEG